MTPKEKAKKLVEKMHREQEGYYLDNINNAKQCALIAVEEMIKMEKKLQEYTGQVFFEYELEDIKQEIEKL